MPVLPGNVVWSHLHTVSGLPCYTNDLICAHFFSSSSHGRAACTISCIQQRSGQLTPCFSINSSFFAAAQREQYFWALGAALSNLALLKTNHHVKANHHASHTIFFASNACDIAGSAFLNTRCLDRVHASIIFSQCGIYAGCPARRIPSLQ